MSLIFTYPRTSSDGDKPVTLFKAAMAKTLRLMADNEEQRAKVTLSLKRDLIKAHATASAYRTAADLLDSTIIEGE